MSIELKVTGMSCNHCKAAVETALKGVSGVKNVQVNLEAGRAEIEGEGVNLGALLQAVADEGYSAQVAGQ